jgi:hypothetical protein
MVMPRLCCDEEDVRLGVAYGRGRIQVGDSRSKRGLANTYSGEKTPSHRTPSMGRPTGSSQLPNYAACKATTAERNTIKMAQYSASPEGYTAVDTKPAARDLGSRRPR